MFMYSLSAESFKEPLLRKFANDLGLLALGNKVFSIEDLSFLSFVEARLYPCAL